MRGTTQYWHTAVVSMEYHSAGTGTGVPACKKWIGLTSCSTGRKEFCHAAIWSRGIYLATSMNSKIKIHRTILVLPSVNVTPGPITCFFSQSRLSCSHFRTLETGIFTVSPVAIRPRTTGKGTSITYAWIRIFTLLAVTKHIDAATVF